MKKITQLEAL